MNYYCTGQILIVHVDTKDTSSAEHSSDSWLILQAWGLQKWDGEETLHIDLGADNVIYSLVHNCCPFPPVEPGAPTNFHCRHIACGIEYQLRGNHLTPW
jgi:hypothetical protein